MIKKNKPKAKTTMMDFIKDNQDPVAKQTAVVQSNVHAFKYTDDYMNQVQEYNKNLTNLDPMYTSIKPLHEILVRFYLHEPKRVGSLVMPFKESIPVATKSGQATYANVESDFPFALKAVVVNAPENNVLKTGDTIAVSHKATQLLVLGTGANAEIKIEQSFIHPDSGLQYPPSDLTNQHYGYALIQYYEVKAKL